MQGLPFGEGGVWRHARSRGMAMALVVLAFVPILGLFAPAVGALTFPLYELTVVAPALGAIVGLALFARQREAGVYRRMIVGLWAGVLGVLAYDVGFLLFATGGYTDGLVPLWSGVGIWGEQGSWAGAVFHHWITFGALWGMAYGLLVGKARWLYGVWYGLALWAAMAFFSLFVPFGGPFVPGGTAGAMMTLLVAYAVFGAVLGLINERLQPDERLKGKIIFLRDYQRVRNRK